MLNGENDVSVMAENADESQQRLKEIQIILHHSQNYDLKKLQGNISLWENQAVQVRLTEDPLFEMTENTENGELLILSDDSDLCKLCFQRKIPVLGILSTEETKDFNILPYVASGLEELELKFLIGIWQRFQQLPWDIAITNRCRIRESIESDLDSFYEIYRDPSITKYMEDLYQDREIEKVHMRDTILSGYRFYGFGVWTICLKESNEIIGRAGLSMREGYLEPEIGYLIAAPHQNQGYGEEVCRAVLSYGFEELGFDTIQLLTRPENTISVKLAIKLGFLYQNTVAVQGMLHDRYILKRKNMVDIVF